MREPQATRRLQPDPTMTSIVGVRFRRTSRWGAKFAANQPLHLTAAAYDFPWFIVSPAAAVGELWRSAEELNRYVRQEVRLRSGRDTDAGVPRRRLGDRLLQGRVWRRGIVAPSG